MRPRLARAAFAALTVVALGAPVEVARAQGTGKALVYCPVGIDDVGCSAIVNALGSLYLGGVDRGYDGAGGTIKLATADLSGYRVIVIPSLADDSSAAPYGLLRDPAVAQRLHGVLFGRTALWSGTPDQGTASRTEKDALIQNLATWAGGNFDKVLRPGLVVLQDQSANTASRYDWLPGLVNLNVVADSTPNVFSNVQSVDPAAAEILSYVGGELSYPNMASYGFSSSTKSKTSSIRQTGTTSGQMVLFTVSASVSGAAAIQTDKPDYAPGQTVIITGTGFKPGEKVTITLQEDPQLHPQVVLTSTADGIGSFTNTQFVPEEHDLGIRFVATAVGDSGSTAQTTFTDANNFAVSPNAQIVPAGVVQNYSWTFTAQNSANVATTTFTIPAGWTPPSTTVGGAGEVVVTAGTCAASRNSVSGMVVTINQAPGGCNNNTTFILEYKNATAPSPTVTTAYTFTNQFGQSPQVTVNAAVGTTLTLAAPSPASVSFGSTGSVTLSATLTRTVGGAAVVGATVTFTVDGPSVGTAVTNGSGLASVTTYNPSALSVGPHSVQSSFAGGVVSGTAYNASTSGTQTLTVTKAASMTTVTRTTGPNPSTYGQSVQFTATVTSTVGTPTGSVTFYDGGTCTTPGPTLSGPTGLVSGQASFTTTALTVTGSPHTILACYGGDTNYNTSSGSLAHTVNKAALTVTANNASRIYGDANPAFTAVITGFVNGETLGTSGVTGTASLTTTATVTSSVAGSPYVIAAALGTLAAGNYMFSFVNGQLTVLVRPITVTADAKSKVYGDADPPLTYQITTGSLVGSDAFTGSLTRVAGESVTGSPYAIQQGTLALSANYTLTYIGASLNIAARPITVTADAKTKVYGNTDPTFTYQVTSGALVSGDGFSGALTRAAGENVGTYFIQQGTLTAGSSYTLTFVSANLTITARPITVTADAQPKVYGNADPTFTYQVTTGTLAFSDVFSGVLARAAGEAVGSYAITVGSLTAGTNYTLTFVGANLTITPRPITVTADAKTKVYGNVDPALTYQITAGTLAFSDAFTGALTRATGENVNSYAITQGTLALSTNYTLTYVSANFTITSRPISITADPKSKVYGDADPALTYQLTSGTLVSGDAITGALTRAAGENVGTYAITQGTVTAGSNYTITFISASLNITERPITVTADAQTKVYGNADPTFTYQMTSGTLVSGDVFSGALSRVAGQNVGTYAIQRGTLTAGSNYALTFVSANLTITARPITVTADAQTKVYGAPDPALTYQITAGTLAFTDAFTGALVRAVGENVGTYAVTQGTLALSTNYTLTFVGANLTITPRPITVTADAKTKVYGNVDPALTYQITAGTLAFSDAFTGALTRATGENVGTYAITQGTLALSTNYTLTFVGANLTITPRPISITADSKSKVYGDADPALTYQLTSGTLVSGDAFAGLLARNAGENVGTYAITQGTVTAGPNYTITYIGANLTITPRPITVTADAQTKVYGNADPVLSYQITTGNLAFSDVFSGVLARAAGEAMGSYAITVGSLTAGTNYTLTFVGANLTITPRPITVTADAKTKVYGNVDPALTYQITAGTLAFSDAFTGALTRATGENVGTYAITQGTLALSTNYTLTFVGANLTITPRPITVTADAKTKVYGNVDPALTYQITAGTLAFSDAFTGALTRATGENVGTYAITQSTLALSTNYTLAYVGANFTITPKPLTISVLSVSKNFGAVTPPALAFSVSYSAFAFSETPAVLTGTLTFTPGAATFTNTTVAGVYPIAASGLSSPNYGITYDPGSFTIFDTTAPIVSGSIANPNPVPLNTAITLNAIISDATTGGSNISSACYRIDTSGVPGPCVAMNGAFGGSTVNVSATIPGSTLTTADVFEVCIYGTDSATPVNNTNTRMDCVLVAVYDPSAGFVTGGGWITSPVGAYLANPSLTGKATFGFVAKYKKGQQTPEGNTEFQFQAAGMNFKATSYEWLVVAGSKAQYKGVGTINGTAGYGFMLTALDGDASGNKKPDSFRMKIWRVSDGSIVYDNNLGASDTGDPATTLGGGSIVIHNQ